MPLTKFVRTAGFIIS